MATTSAGRAYPSHRRDGPSAARELDHRIGNSLQLAADFLLLQQTRLRDPFARAALIDAAERLVAVGHLHRFLCAHDGGDLIDLRSYLRELAAIVGQSTGLRCTAEAEAVRVPSSLAQQLGLAVNELAINAAKHAYDRRESGVLLIRAERRGSALELTVADRGGGLAPSFDPENAGGLGMGILQAIVRQLHGRLDAYNEDGACFTLSVPLADGEPRSFAGP